MYCSNCKTKIKENDKYCIRCGKIFDKEYFLNSEEFDIEKKLLKEIIKYDKFNESFSKKFLLLNFVYAFYRKQYFIGCVNFLNVFILIKTLINIPLIMALFAFPIIGIVVVYSLMIMYYYISNFDRIYVDKVFLKLCQIIKTNRKKDYNELKQICMKEFKPDILLAIISGILFIILIF